MALGDIMNFDIIADDSKFLKKYNNIYISEEQENILLRYEIDVCKYKNINELLYDIEDILNNSYTSLEDLEWVSESLSEYNYYNNTNK